MTISPPDVLLGSQSPTRLLIPSGGSTSAGDEAVELAAIAGLHLFPWQQDVLRWSLAERTDGKWAAFEVGLIVSRQNGKGSILEARQLAGLFLLGERLQVHTAHEFKTCLEHFLRVSSLIENCPDLYREVRIIRQADGAQSIELRNGNRLRFLTRSKSSGRGFSSDALYLDEAMQLERRTMGSIMPTMSARPNPQIWYTASAPLEESEVLHSIRERGLSGDTEQRLFFASWEASPDDDPTSPDVWAACNPSYGLVLEPEAVRQESLSLHPDEFARERLGVPTPPASKSTPPITPDAWAAILDTASAAVDPIVLGIDATPDRRASSIAVAGRRADGLAHVDLIDNRQGISWLVERIVDLNAKWSPLAVVVDPASPAGAVVAELEIAGVPIVKRNVNQLATACGAFVDAVAERTVHHRGHPLMHAAVQGARKRNVGESLWAWSRKDSSTDISPLVAATLAFSALPEVGREPAPFFVY